MTYWEIYSHWMKQIDIDPFVNALRRLQSLDIALGKQNINKSIISVDLSEFLKEWEESADMLLLGYKCKAPVSFIERLKQIN